MHITGSSWSLPRVPSDQRIRAVHFVADMIEYRNAEITRIADELRQGIRLLHRERRAKKHARQMNELAAMTDRLFQLITDTEYDANHLQVYLTRTLVKTEPLHTNPPEKSPHDLHYFQ